MVAYLRSMPSAASTGLPATLAPASHKDGGSTPEATSDTGIAAAANYVTARFGSKRSNLTAQNMPELRKQTSQ